MRLPVVSCLALAATTALHPLPALSATRATVTTPVLPTRPTWVKPFHPDSAAPPESTVFLQFVGICPAGGCEPGRPICPTDSIRVTLGGSLPSSCYFIRRIDLYVPPYAGLRTTAPWVRVLVDVGACLGRPCFQGRFPWSDSITLPPLPAGPNVLNIAVIKVSCSDSVPPPPWPLQSFAFEVANCDSGPGPPPYACFLTSWDHFGSPTGCDVTVAPDAPARLTLQLATRVPLAGLQGSFELSPPVLRITNIEPVGVARDMKIAWAPNASGAEFVMFSDGTGQIPPTPPDGTHEPVLTVSISMPIVIPVGGTIPPTTELLTRSLLAADLAGNGVPPCPILTLAPDKPALVYVPPPRICSPGGCDINHDSFTDVRDLVVMVRCLYQRALCPNFFDCNGDSIMSIDDVLCCAWKILRISPDSTGGAPPRVDPAVEVRVGLPAAVEGGEVRVPIHIAGADHVGAARLAMRFPTDRWSLAGLDADDHAWLTIAGVERGEAVMGVIRTGPAVGPSELNLTLRLRPLGGAPAGGELGALQASLSATDGVMLRAPIVAPVRPLPGRAVELSENRPDPFSNVTHFTLSLPQANVVDLGVFDLNGRRVTTLHRGPLAAGVSEFGWNGRNASGDALGSGVYFYRAVAGGFAVTRRMVYLGSR